jgi:hypothetical protein
VIFGLANGSNFGIVISFSRALGPRENTLLHHEELVSQNQTNGSKDVGKVEYNNISGLSSYVPSYED